VLIDRPVADVFAYVEDWTHATDYTQSLMVWEPLGEVVDGVGARFRGVMRVGPTAQESMLEIVRRELDTEIAWESRSGFGQKGEYTFEAVDGGTRVGFAMDLTLPGGLAGRMLGAVIGPFAQENTATTLANLKRILESP